MTVFSKLKLRKIVFCFFLFFNKKNQYQIKKRENQSSIDQSDDMKNRQSIDGADPTMINGQDDDDDDEFTKLKNTIEQRINDIRTTIESRCLIM